MNCQATRQALRRMTLRKSDWQPQESNCLSHADTPAGMRDCGPLRWLAPGVRSPVALESATAAHVQSVCSPRSAHCCCNLHSLNSRNCRSSRQYPHTYFSPRRPLCCLQAIQTVQVLHVRLCLKARRGERRGVGPPALAHLAAYCNARLRT